MDFFFSIVAQNKILSKITIEGIQKTKTDFIICTFNKKRFEIRSFTFRIHYDFRLMNSTNNSQRGFVFGALSGTYKINDNLSLTTTISRYNTPEKEHFDIAASYRLGEVDSSLGSENFGEVEFSEEEQTYYVPFEIFTSTASQEKINADDLTTITFNWLPTDSNSTELDLEISDVRFVKKAGNDGLTVEPIITYDNQYLAYPNPSEGHVTTLLFSDKAVDATVTLHDITGKIVYKGTISLQEGKNEIDLNFNVSPGIMLLNIATNEHNFGTTKMIFR